MRRAIVTVGAAVALAAAAPPGSSAHTGGWWWTEQQATHMTFWWSATHHLDTTCTGIGRSISSRYSEVEASHPAVHGDVQPEQGMPLFHHFRCRSVDLRTRQAFTWSLHPTGKYASVSVFAGLPPLRAPTARNAG